MENTPPYKHTEKDTDTQINAQTNAQTNKHRQTHIEKNNAADQKQKSKKEMDD